MFNAEEYIAKYQQCEKGPARLRAIKEAIRAADEAKSAEWSFRFRDRAMRESTFESDDVDSMIIFPEMMALYDNNEELQLDDDFQYTLLWDFKWMLNNAVDFPKIPLEKILEFYEEFKKRLIQCGKSLRPYYYMLESFAEDTGNPMPDGVKFGRFQMEKEDGLEDCRACEASHIVRMDLLNGNREAALKHSERIFSGELRCTEIPQNTYGIWVYHDILAGEYDHAKQMAKRLMAMLRNEIDMSLLNEVGNLLRLYAVVDRHLGTVLFRRSIRLFVECRNPRKRLDYSIGAYRLFDKMEMEEINLILPRDFALWKEDHTYKSADLAEYFFNEAKKLAEQFDKRNGNTDKMDELMLEEPPYDAEAIDLVHGDAAQEPSVLGAVYPTLPEGLTVENVKDKIEATGQFKVAEAGADEEHGVLLFQVAKTDGSLDLYKLLVTVQPVPDISDFRPATMVQDTELEKTKDAEGVIMVGMPFEELQPDLALREQIKLLHMICPDAATYLDYTRMKLLPAGWVKMQAASDVPPMVDYLYNLRLSGDAQTGAVWISTRGLNACGMRDMEILDANRENYGRFCDLLAFAVEGHLLRGEMPDADTPFTVLRKTDGMPLRCVWLPASKAGAEIDEAHADGMKLRSNLIGDEAELWDKNGIYFLYDGENPDGTVRKRLLSTLTEDEFNAFCYGDYINTSRKKAALAKERYADFCKIVPEADKAYACVTVQNGNDEDEIWIEITGADENGIDGLFTAECAAGKEGDKWHAEIDSLTDFTLILGDMRIGPNTVYAGLELIS
ncbi:MAG: DUF4026 domain-containing protein [Oscillospiraceae bacterium]|nr:DUF4026 domain-containing protein [Oscillospiraceae bacterium]